MSLSRRTPRSSPGPRGSSTSLRDHTLFDLDIDQWSPSLRSRRPSSSNSNRPLRPRRAVSNIRRWDGVERTTVEWDGLRRDSDLWDPDGDCLVYLHNHGTSQRGPSFRLPYDIIRAANSIPFFNQFSTQTYLERPWYENSQPNTPSSETYTYDFAIPVYHELYVPASPHLSREQAFEYHLDTRNFFAWMFCRPIVGKNLGQALVSLWRRMEVFRSNDEGNQQDIMDYIDEQGYSDFRECPDHALGVLYFAEELQMQHLWTDAFVHCVGMNDRLTTSPGLESITRTTKALITRARLEMDIRIDHAERQLTTFLDDELSSAYLGLGEGARTHLDRFRSFLHAFYVAKFGYWPPRLHDGVGDSALSKATYFSMYTDFRNLYEYLMDEQSSPSIDDNKPVNGGLCVLQNITAFDRRHRYTSLPHPLPLLPDLLDNAGRDRSREARRTLIQPFHYKSLKATRRATTLAALSAATNAHNTEVMKCPLVRAYIGFERGCTTRQEDKVSATDARKVRWLLIYGVLQTLISVTGAPIEVRDTEDVSYNLCCQTAGTPPWTIKGATTTSSTPAINKELPQTPKPEPLIRPDREYHQSRNSSVNDLLAKASAEATAAASTGRRSPGPSQFCEILVPGYGNGLNAADVVESPSSSNLDPGNHHHHHHQQQQHGLDPELDPSTPDSSSRSRDECRWSGQSDEVSASTSISIPELEHPSVGHAMEEDHRSLQHHQNIPMPSLNNSPMTPTPRKGSFQTAYLVATTPGGRTGDGVVV
ncbi:MAG: hypothetical protein M1816_002820 [Peltula sp. TS41687]|nr:MAG: hypothetical protein M1816_002820 [Peltula sp. TS41687]